MDPKFQVPLRLQETHSLLWKMDENGDQLFIDDLSIKSSDLIFHSIYLKKSGPHVMIGGI